MDRHRAGVDDAGASRHRREPVEQMPRAGMVDEQVALARVGVDVRREVEDAVDRRRRRVADRLTGEIAVQQPDALGAIGLNRLRFERRRRRLDEAHDRLGAVGVDQTPHQSAADEPGRAGHEHRH